MIEMIVDILKNTAMITGFVMVMMLLIEFVNVKSRGTFNEALTKRPHLQILLATLLGLVPGCLGTFTVVSLFTHRILGFGALIAALIASSGDEAFFMISMMPEQTMWLFLILAITAIVVGYMVDFFVGEKIAGKFAGHFVIHEHEAVSPDETEIGGWRHQFNNMSFHRSLLLFGILTFIVVISLGMLSHEHAQEIGDAVHEHHGGHLGWMDYTFIAVSVLTLYVVSTVSEHFLEEHLWKHILKKHFIRILLWSLGALTVAAVLKEYVHLLEYHSLMLWGMLVMALLIGIIPESGPHMVFVTLFISGNIPLSILVASSIVQDGHGAIPLFAESPKHFFIAKIINLAAGALVGGSMLFFGY